MRKYKVNAEMPEMIPVDPKTPSGEKKEVISGKKEIVEAGNIAEAISKSGFDEWYITSVAVLGPFEKKPQ